MKRIIVTIFFTLLAVVSAFAQNSLAGIVKSATSGEPLAGVMVYSDGASVYAMTDNAGNYLLENVAENSVIAYSLLGYKDYRFTYHNESRMDVTLSEDAVALDDVVVVGYGVVKKSDLTSSISTVKGEEIHKLTSGNAMNALQGKVNGVQVVSGGGPGASPQVLIRGVTTVNGSSPLYVVDGMPVGDNINFLNNDDIKSMEVLKDASAAAIYGTRASNGVILITTKHGIEGAAKFTVSASVGFQTIANPHMAGAAEYEKVFRESYTNDGRTPNWNGKNKGETDWWNETVRKVALMHSYTIGFQGGSSKFKYSGSLGYFRNDSQYDYGYWDKINARFNTEYIFNKYVSIGVNMAPYIESWDNTPDLFTSAMSMDPTTPVMIPENERTDDVYSNYSRSHNNEIWNPVASIARMNESTRKYGLIMTPFIQVNPVKGLTLRTQFGINANFARSSSFSPAFFIDAMEKNDHNNTGRTMSENFDWNSTNTITYQTTFAKKHNLNVMAGFTAEKFTNFWVSGSREDIPGNSDNLHEVSAGTKNQKSSGMSGSSTLVSYLGRLMYNFDSRYYITASVRADGSSRFPKGNKYAVFPAVSVAWRLGNEAFMKNQKVISDMKIRAGWGRVGNQNIPNDAYLSLISSADSGLCTDYVFGIDPDRFVGSAVSSMGNPTLRWETVEDVNVGIDISMFDSRFDVVFDWFHKKSKDMLFSKENIYSVGYPQWNSAMWTNIGSMSATGWELSLGWNDHVGHFTYGIGINAFHVKNKAIKFSGNGPVYSQGFNQDHIIRNEDGGEISRFYGFVADGLFQNWTDVYSHSNEHGDLIQPNAKPGDIRFMDLNSDGVLNEKDKTWIGKGFADLSLGLNLNLGYKGFDFVANFYGTFGNDIYNTTKQFYSGKYGNNVFSGTLNKVWRGDGTSNAIPRLSVNDSNNNYTRVSSFYVEDGSYFRCKLLQLGYTFPLKKDNSCEMRVALSAQNLFTLTKYSGMDPERPQMGSVLGIGVDRCAYPNPRTFLFNIEFKF